jgi:hypothetical protein
MISKYRVGDIVIVQPYHRAKDEVPTVYEVVAEGLAGEMILISPLVWPIGEERPTRTVQANTLQRIP